MQFRHVGRSPSGERLIVRCLRGRRIAGMRDSTIDVRAGSCQPRAASLDAWSSRDWSCGIDVTRLSPLDELTVTTRNSTYTILIVNPSSGEVKIRGGAYFPSFATARVCGSSLGRGFLKRHVVHAGFCLEVTHQELGLIVTTRVRTAVVTAGLRRAASGPVM